MLWPAMATAAAALLAAGERGGEGEGRKPNESTGGSGECGA